MKREKWMWMPHAGHFIGSAHCRFHLNTYVGGYIVSTVGEYLPDSQVREILAECRKVKLEGNGDYREADYMKKIGYEAMGCDKEYKYETMVFKARKSENKCCCPYEIIVEKEKDSERYKTAEEAYKGHLKYCKKWGK